MSLLGPPPRGNDPLNVWMMALALVAAAVLGAALGFVIDAGKELVGKSASDEAD